MKFICPKCDFEIKTSREKHVKSCNGKGPRRKQQKKGYNPWNKGLTKETSEKILVASENLIRKHESGELIPWWTGKHHSKETIEKIKKHTKFNVVSRSKNEIYFAELCSSEFNKVLTNEKIFNGWDADVILPELKIAILWNGKWHYEKVLEGHKLNQVQNRDKIKLKEIKKMNYIPYIIKDMGGYNKRFVEKEFEKFKKWRGSLVG